MRQALADRYRIEHVLGEGGMATVYLAEDLKHHRKVAVKVMRPELAATLGSDRFLREVEIAAKLSHPNILAVYDSGSADGILYYVMPLVEGESLPARLACEKQLPVADALRIAREVAEALAYAHERGIVHRDIKPANILISAGHALVADFGIARAANAGDARVLTQTGLAIGTPQYMSPEQAMGDTVDGRADIYALGAVLYEMISGEPPFTGPTAQSIIARSLSEAPRPLQQTRATLAPAVSSVVLTALAKSPADRFRGASEMVTAICAAEDQSRFGTGAETPALISSSPARGGWQKWAIGAAAVVAVAVGAWYFAGNRGAGPTQRSVAVLPFDNQGAEEDAYFASGIVDELRDKLSRVDQLAVTASASSDQYRATTKTPQQIAKELGVQQVLTGKVSWLPGENGTRKVKVVSELLDGGTGAVTWRETFDADMTDASQIEGRIATRVAAALGTVLGASDAKALAGRPTQNADAYDLYLKAAAIHSNSAGALRTKAGYLEQAVALDSSFARAWGFLSSTLSTLYFNGNRDPVVGRRAKETLDQLLKLASDSAGAHMVAADYHTNISGDTIAARREVDRALELDSNYTGAMLRAAQFDIRAGENAAANAKLARARKLDPRSLGVLASLQSAQLALGDYDEAAGTAEEIIALKPGPNLVEQAIYAHLARGDIASAKSAAIDAQGWTPATELVSYFAGYQELAFVLSDEQRTLLFRLTPAAFDNDRGWWGQSLATAAYQQGDMKRARAYADSSLSASKQATEVNPTDAQARILYALMLAYVGRTPDANREAERAMSVLDGPSAQNLWYMELQAARVYLAGGQFDRAMDHLEKIVALKSFITPGYLRVDPMFKPLRGNARFEKLLAPAVKLKNG